MMSFKKNLLTIAEAMVVALLASWVAGVSMAQIVYGLTLCIPVAIFSLYLEDLNRKVFTDRSLLTAQYYIGGVIIFAALIAWFWASKSQTALEQGVRLGVTFLLSVVGYLWFTKAYKRSIQSEEERELERIIKYEERYEKRWKGIRKKIQKATKEEAIRYININLAYHLVGDTLDGDINFDVPLAVVNDQPVTYNQLISMKEDESGVIATKRAAAYQYIQNLVQGKE